MKVRLTSVLIVVAGLAMTVRIGELWKGVAEVAWAQPAEPARTAGEAWQGAPAAGKTNAAEPDEDEAREADRDAEAQGAAAAAGANGSSGARARELPADPLSMTDEEVDLLFALAERRQELDRRARQLAEREALLQAAERRIEEKVEGLKALQKSIEDRLRQHEEQTESQYRSLVKIYENMRPKDAARIFDELDMPVLLPVVERMKERKTAPILAEMRPDKAKAITTELAQRRRLPEAGED